MSERPLVTETACCLTRGDLINLPAGAALVRLVDAYKSIPKEYRAAATLEIYTDYDDYTTDLEIKYQRPISDEELAEEAAREQGRLLARENEERRLYEVLRKKYGDA